MIILSIEDGLFKVGNIEKTVAFMNRVMKPGDWLLQEVPKRIMKKNKIRLLVKK